MDGWQPGRLPHYLMVGFVALRQNQPASSGRTEDPAAQDTPSKRAALRGYGLQDEPFTSLGSSHRQSACPRLTG